MVDNEGIDADYIVVKAREPMVQIIGMTRGNETRPHHTEVIGDGEVVVMQFTENTSIIKIRGNAEIYTKHGVITSGK